MSLSGAQKRFEDLQRRFEIIPHAVSDTANKEQNTLLQLNKDNMLLGRDTEDKEFKPGYTEDDFFDQFKNPRAMAAGYRDMKTRLRSHNRLLIQYLTDQPEKDPNTPDLFIDGTMTQEPMFITINPGGFEIMNNDERAREMNAKYNGKVYGLSPIARDYFWNNFLVFALRRHIYGTK